MNIRISLEYLRNIRISEKWCYLSICWASTKVEESVGEDYKKSEKSKESKESKKG